MSAQGVEDLPVDGAVTFQCGPFQLDRELEAILWGMRQALLELFTDGFCHMACMKTGDVVWSDPQFLIRTPCQVVTYVYRQAGYPPLV